MKPDKPSFFNPRVLRALGIIGLFLVTNPVLSIVATGGGVRPARDQGQLARYLSRYEEIRMDPAEVARQVRATGEFLVVTPSEAFDILLEPNDVRAPGYRAEEVTAEGEIRPVPPTPLRTYRGSARGFPESEARFTVSDDFFEGVILTPNEWYYMEPRRNFAPDSDRYQFVVYRRSDIQPDAVGTCATTLAERIGETPSMFETMVLAEGGVVYIAEVATEADYEYVTASGGAANANSTILDVINQVDGIYQTQLGISLQVIYQHAWSTPDDPYASTSPSTMLTEFTNYWNANFYYSTPFDLAHMWTGKDMDGSAIGIAYLGVVCYARTYSYGVSQRFNSSPGKYILTAHEIGHNFGANHTEQASPPQTDCGNTIMSSYVGTGTSFCPYSRNEIATWVAQHNACMTSAPSELTAAAVSSSRINLAWSDNSSNETGFKVERKTGAAGTWAVAASTGANATSLSDTGLSSGTTYYYRVQATSGAVSSPYSNEASATTTSEPPTITGMLPSSGGIGTSVTISGTSFMGATTVRFNNTDATSFMVSSPSQIVAVVPAGATTGKISVTTPGGTAVSVSDFVVITCDFSVSPLDLSFSVEGGGGSVTVTTSGSCTWTATSNATWVNITAGGSSTGNGTASFTVSANGAGSLRSGTLTIAGQTVTVRQGGNSCDLNIDGSVNALDIQSLINAVLGIGSTPSHYDINRDGGINVLDLQQLANVILGINACP